LPGDLRAQGLDHGARLLGRGRRGEDYPELVAAQACEQIDLAQSPPQDRRSGDEQLVTDAVAVHV
jgi:hypothetical protein